MRELSKLAKFFIICAAVFFVGLVCAIGGVVCGGPDGLEQVAERYDWVHYTPGERSVTAQKVDDFHSIEVTGDMDLYIVGKEFYKNASWLADQDMIDGDELDVLGKNKVCVICGDKVEQPEIEVKKGVLKINSGSVDMNGINLNLSDESWYPTILVCAPDEVLESLTVSGETGDVDILGASWKTADIQLNYGDLTVEGVKSGALQAELDAGDMEIQGKLMGRTRVATDAGDIEIDTPLARAEYALKLRTDAGDLEVKETGRSAEVYEGGYKLEEYGGPHKLNVRTFSGDVEVHFGN